MAHCEVTWVLWFHFLGLHFGNIVFTNLLDFLATITHVNTKLGPIGGLENQNRIMTAAIILKRTWEARCDVVLNNIPVDIGKVVQLVG